MSDSAKPFALVVVETGHVGRLRDINSVCDAGQMLLFEWPTKGRGKAYAAALRACLNALEGKAMTAPPRDTFIAAAQEAAIFVRG